MRLIFLGLLAFISCNSSKRNSLIYVYPKDKSQIISIISNYDTAERIIAVGKVSEKPKDNYVTLDISQIVEVGDEIGICWDTDKDGWQLVSNEAKIINVSLDTTKYIIKTKWIEDINGIPNVQYYIKDGCFTFGTLNYSKMYPQDNGIIEREK